METEEGKPGIKSHAKTKPKLREPVMCEPLAFSDWLLIQLIVRAFNDSTEMINMMLIF